MYRLGISNLCPEFHKYPVVLLIIETPSPSEETVEKISGCCAWDTPKSKFL